MPPAASGASTCIADNIFPAAAIAALNRLAEAAAARSEPGGIVLSDAKHARVAEVRLSQVTWLGPEPEHRPIYDFMAGFVQKANAEVFGLALERFDEPFQLATYTAEAHGFYGWHVDIGPGRLANRKLSLVVPLTDPADYDGGAFEVFHDSEPTRIDMPLGRVLAFPSYLLHRVTPVTRGVRRTLAVWVSGPPFR